VGCLAYGKGGRMGAVGRGGESREPGEEDRSAAPWMR
jgi:hypothetical protein